MLKVLKGVLIVLGVVFVVAAIVLLIWDIVQVNSLVTVANANQASSAEPNSNPWLWILLAGIGAVVGGFLLGFGLGIPKRTFKQRLQDAPFPQADTI